jgi:hypothetical protein
MSEERRGGAGGSIPAEYLSFLTTEHFTLQSQRAAATAEASSRLQLYVGALSGAIVALALVAQVSDLGGAFRGFALVLLPVVYLLGLATMGRLAQLWTDWFKAGQGMGRIRHYFVELAPELRPYLIMPTTDDPWETLSGIGIGSSEGHRWWHPFVTAPAVVGTIDSVVAGVFAGLAASLVTDETWLAVAAGVLGGVASMAAMTVVGNRGFYRRMREARVEFPAEGSATG